MSGAIKTGSYTSKSKSINKNNTSSSTNRAGTNNSANTNRSSNLSGRTPFQSSNNKPNPKVLGIVFGAIGLMFLFMCGLFFMLLSVGEDITDSGDSTTESSQQFDTTISIISGSENKGLEPILQEYATANEFNLDVTYKGSVDIMLKLNEDSTSDIDAVWPASSVWLNLTDNEKVQHEQSIMRTPVVLALKKDKVENLGWIDKEVEVQDLLDAIKANELSFAMTNATQSNSGLSGYMAFLYAFSGNPDVLSLDNLEQGTVRENVKEILQGINRSSGSSGWLKEQFIDQYENFDSMINYEALIIEGNQELIAQGKEPLHTVYLKDGIVVADSPLAYIDKDDDKKEEIFLKLQEFLLSNDTQNQILNQGRRTDIGLSLQNYDSSVFNADWGIKPEITYSTIKFPNKEVIEEMLNLYQLSLRKPSYTVYLLDVSGSMQGEGISQLKQAMNTLVNQESAKKYLLQASPEDVHVVIPFNGNIVETVRFTGNESEELNAFSTYVNSLEAGGSTDMYTPLMEAFNILNNEENINNYFPSIILMSDGQSENENLVSNLPTTKDISVFPIMFGQASELQLDKIIEITSGRVFDGRENLTDAFRNAKGYN